MSARKRCATLTCRARATAEVTWRATAVPRSFLCDVCADRWSTLTMSVRMIRDRVEANR